MDRTLLDPAYALTGNARLHGQVVQPDNLRATSAIANGVQTLGNRSKTLPAPAGPPQITKERAIRNPRLTRPYQPGMLGDNEIQKGGIEGERHKSDDAAFPPIGLKNPATSLRPTRLVRFRCQQPNTRQEARHHGIRVFNSNGHD